MDNPTVPTPAPQDADADRVAHYPRVNVARLNGVVAAWNVGAPCTCSTPWHHAEGLA